MNMWFLSFVAKFWIIAVSGGMLVYFILKEREMKMK